jgi:hypothetical protein
MQTMTTEYAKENSGAAPSSELVLDLKAPISDREMRGVKRENPGRASDGDSDDGTNAGAVKAYEKLYPTFRFSCMTRRVIYDLLIEDLQDGKLEHWPRKLVQNEDGTFRSQLWIPSLSHFYSVLREIQNISFWKNPTFTKCNTCVTLRNCERRRTIAQSERNDIRKARNQHCFYIMSEVVQHYYT